MFRPPVYLLLALFMLWSSYSVAQSASDTNVLLKSARSAKDSLDALLKLAKDEEDDGRTIEYANKALKIATRIKDEKAKTAALDLIGCAYFNKEKFSDAIGYLDRALSISNVTGDIENKGRALLYLGRSFYELGKYAEATRYLNDLSRFEAQLKDPVIRAVFYNTLGGLYLDRGNIPLAHEYYMKEVDISEKNGLKVYLAQGYNNLALIYDMQKKYDKALEYYQKDLQISLEIGDEEELSLSYNNIGDIYLSLGDYEKAKENIEKAVEIAERLNYIYGLSILYNSLGTYYDRIGDEKKAWENYLKDLDYATRTGNKYNLVESYYTLGDFKIRTGDASLAEEYFTKSLELALQIDALQGISDAYRGLARVFEYKKDYKKAFIYHVKFKNFYDSVFTRESEKTVSELSSRYESEKKEQTIQLLNKETELKNTEIKKQKMMRYFFTLGFLLMIGLAFVIFLSYKTKRKANDKLTLQKAEIEIKNSELQKQRDVINEKQKEIVDSINYARRIQESLLAHDAILNMNLKDHFVMFRPKDIVSGDFYWAAETSNKFFLAVCDSTGHGVPGAFMSLLNIGYLSEAIKEKGIVKPNEVFDYVRGRLIENISREEQKDGFDGMLMCVDKQNKKITYAAANNKPVLIQKGEAQVLPTDKMPVGLGENTKPFTLYEVPYSEGAMLYLFTDGYADQFGGERGKKFKYKQLINSLASASKLDTAEQREMMNETFDAWKGTLEQVDDVCLLGISV